jgi:Ca2+-binding EF-hand superfamily protein
MFIDGRYEASIPVQETLHALALRRAIVVAHASVSAMTRSCSSIMVSEQVRLLRELTELEISLKQIEASVLLKMGTEMKQKEKVLIVYDVLNSDGDAGISVSELAEGLRKLNEKQNFQEVIPVAEKAIAYFSEDGVLSPDQVESFLENLSLSLRTSFHSLCQLCIAKIGFGTTGRAILEEMVAHIDHDDVGSEEFDNQISFSRMVLLFQMIDGKLEGKLLRSHYFYRLRQ